MRKGFHIPSTSSIIYVHICICIVQFYLPWLYNKEEASDKYSDIIFCIRLLLHFE